MIIARMPLVALTLAAATVSAQAQARDTSADATITSSIDSALDAYPQLGAEASIQVQAIGRVVYLHGLVDTNPDRALVQSVAEKTPGVDRVVNALELQNE